MEKVARRAGYRISGETGSALIAEGNGRRFYIWTTPAATAEEIENAGKIEDWQPFGRVDGVQVYGDESVWRWWMGKSLTIWLQAGPTKDSPLPSLTEMESLVRASKTVPAP